MSEQRVGDVPKRLSWWRRLLARLPGFCSYCGRRYRSGVALVQPSLLNPLPPDGRYCPDQHEGYYDVFYGYGFIRYGVDNVATKEGIAKATG